MEGTVTGQRRPSEGTNRYLVINRTIGASASIYVEKCVQKCRMVPGEIRRIFAFPWRGVAMPLRVEDDVKLGELIIYISKKSAGDSRFGATKLNKLLYFSDFLSFGNFGS